MTFKLSPATLEDVPGMVDVWSSSFSDSDEANRQWRQWTFESFSKGILDQSLNVSHLVITEESASDTEAIESDHEGGQRGEERRKVIALARWVYYPGGAGGFPKWWTRWRREPPEGVSYETLGTGFYDVMARQHDAIMGEEPHYFLEGLATQKEYRGKGLARRLMEWGHERADRKGVRSYLHAREAVVSVYTRFGYVVQEYREPGAGSRGMVRAAVKRDEE